MSGSVTTRPAEERDVADILALEAEAFPLDAWSAALVTQSLGSPTTAVLVAERDARLVGYAVVSVVGTDADLQRIAVVPDCRQQRVASLLLARTRAHVLHAGGDRLLLEVRDDNEAARAFYAHHGFTELGRRARYYRDGTAALVLTAPVTMVG